MNTGHIKRKHIFHHLLNPQLIYLQSHISQYKLQLAHHLFSVPKKITFETLLHIQNIHPIYMYIVTGTDNTIINCLTRSKQKKMYFEIKMKQTSKQVNCI